MLEFPVLLYTIVRMILEIPCQPQTTTVVQIEPCIMDRIQIHRGHGLGTFPEIYNLEIPFPHILQTTSPARPYTAYAVGITRFLETAERTYGPTLLLGDPFRITERTLQREIRGSACTFGADIRFGQFVGNITAMASRTDCRRRRVHPLTGLATGAYRSLR